MGKITEVLYKEIPEKEFSTKDAAEFFFYHNLLGVDPMFIDGYEKYESNQIHVRNNIIGDAIRSELMNKHPKVNSAIIGVSSVKNKAVLITEI